MKTPGRLVTAALAATIAVGCNSAPSESPTTETSAAIDGSQTEATPTKLGGKGKTARKPKPPLDPNKVRVGKVRNDL